MFLQSHRVKSDFFAEKLILFIQTSYLLTLFPVEAVAMKKWKSKTRDYH